MDVYNMIKLNPQILFHSQLYFLFISWNKDIKKKPDSIEELLPRFS